MSESDNGEIPKTSVFDIRPSLANADQHATLNSSEVVTHAGREFTKKVLSEMEQVDEVEAKLAFVDLEMIYEESRDYDMQDFFRSGSRGFESIIGALSIALKKLVPSLPEDTEGRKWLDMRIKDPRWLMAEGHTLNSIRHKKLLSDK